MAKRYIDVMSEHDYNAVMCFLDDNDIAVANRHIAKMTIIAEGLPPALEEQLLQLNLEKVLIVGNAPLG